MTDEKLCSRHNGNPCSNQPVFRLFTAALQRYYRPFWVFEDWCWFDTHKTHSTGVKADCELVPTSRSATILPAKLMAVKRNLYIVAGYGLTRLSIPLQKWAWTRNKNLAGQQFGTYDPRREGWYEVEKCFFFLPSSREKWTIFSIHFCIKCPKFWVRSRKIAKFLYFILASENRKLQCLCSENLMLVWYCADN